jgi:hypothetical protein
MERLRAYRIIFIFTEAGAFLPWDLVHPGIVET